MAGTKKPDGAVVRTSETAAKVALAPSLNGAAVVHAFRGNLIGGDIEMDGLIAGLVDTFKEVRSGDLHTMEAMLVAQATALQTMFASLARKAVTQEGLRQYEAIMGLALKAQSQSRATVSALVELKYPRQAVFAKQANIAHGPQQVNNGAAAPVETVARAQEPQPEQNKLLESDHGQLGGGLDTGAQAACARSDSAVEAVAAIHGAENRRG